MSFIQALLVLVISLRKKNIHMVLVLEGFVPPNVLIVLQYSYNNLAYQVSVSASLGAQCRRQCLMKVCVLPPNSCGASFVLFGGPVAPALFRAFTPVSLTSHSLGSSSQVIN